MSTPNPSKIQPASLPLVRGSTREIMDSLFKTLYIPASQTQDKPIPQAVINRLVMLDQMLAKVDARIKRMDSPNLDIISQGIQNNLTALRMTRPDFLTSDAESNIQQARNLKSKGSELLQNSQQLIVRADEVFKTCIEKMKQDAHPDSLSLIIREFEKSLRDLNMQVTEYAKELNKVENSLVAIENQTYSAIPEDKRTAKSPDVVKAQGRQTLS